MGGGLLVGVASALIGGLVTLAGVLLALPKLKAEARKTEAEASRTEWLTLYDEIKRLDAMTRTLRRELDTLTVKSADRELELESENKRLKQEIARLKRRIEGLEGILMVNPLPPDMRARLDELDRKTGGGK